MISLSLACLLTIFTDLLVNKYDLFLVAKIKNFRWKNFLFKDDNNEYVLVVYILIWLFNWAKVLTYNKAILVPVKDPGPKLMYISSILCKLGTLSKNFIISSTLYLVSMLLENITLLFSINAVINLD